MIAVTELPAVLAIVNGAGGTAAGMPPVEWNGHPLTCQTCHEGIRRQHEGPCEPVCHHDHEFCSDCEDGHPTRLVNVNGEVAEATLHVVPMWPHQTPPTGRYAIIAVEVP